MNKSFKVNMASAMKMGSGNMGNSMGKRKRGEPYAEPTHGAIPFTNETNSILKYTLGAHNSYYFDKASGEIYQKGPNYTRVYFRYDPGSKSFVEIPTATLPPGPTLLGNEQERPAVPPPAPAPPIDRPAPYTPAGPKPPVVPPGQAKPKPGAPNIDKPSYPGTYYGFPVTKISDSLELWRLGPHDNIYHDKVRDVYWKKAANNTRDYYSFNPTNKTFIKIEPSKAADPGDKNAGNSGNGSPDPNKETPGILDSLDAIITSVPLPLLIGAEGLCIVMALQQQNKIMNIYSAGALLTSFILFHNEFVHEAKKQKK
jgi:hypothetical protein